MDFEEALLKLTAFCAYRERCTDEVCRKMAEWNLPETLQNKLLYRLQAEDYLNDERFAAAYARSKFRQNQWGKVKIRVMLQQKRLPEHLIRAALNGIDSEEYRQTLLDLAARKALQLKKKTVRHTTPQRAIVQFLAGKGFETDLAVAAVRQVWK